MVLCWPNICTMDMVHTVLTNFGLGKVEGDRNSLMGAKANILFSSSGEMWHLVISNRNGFILCRPIPDIVVYDRVGSFAGVTVGRVAKGG